MVVLRANKISRRFKETRKILAWAIYNLYKESLSAEGTKIVQGLRRDDADLDSDYSEEEQEFNFNSLSKQEIKKRRSIITYEM